MGCEDFPEDNFRHDDKPFQKPYSKEKKAWRIKNYKWGIQHNLFDIGTKENYPTKSCIFCKTVKSDQHLCWTVHGRSINIRDIRNTCPYRTSKAWWTRKEAHGQGKMKKFQTLEIRCQYASISKISQNTVYSKRKHYFQSNNITMPS